MKASIRTRWTLRLMALVWGLVLHFSEALAVEPLRFGLTPIFLNERHGVLMDWQAYLEKRLGRPVVFVQRSNYQETLELLNQQRLDAAWLCDCPQVTANPDLQLLATPLFQGRPYYRAYLIVPLEDHKTQSILDLEGRVFAYSDPVSYVGYLNPRYELLRQGKPPDHFFRRTFFAHTHRNAIEAVAAGLADASSVNSYIWETMDMLAPVLTGKTRVAAQSQEFGFPPLVAGHHMPEPEFRLLQKTLLEMAQDSEGLAVLKRMNLDGFTRPRPEIYRQVQDIVRRIKGH